MHISTAHSPDAVKKSVVSTTKKTQRLDYDIETYSLSHGNATTVFSTPSNSRSGSGSPFPIAAAA
jgi:hypothetical protein